MELLVEERTKISARTETGIFVRAKFPNGKWDTADISWLTKESLTEWLRSRGGKNEWAEQVVYIVLGYER